MLSDFSDSMCRVLENSCISFQDAKVSYRRSRANHMERYRSQRYIRFIKFHTNLYLFQPQNVVFQQTTERIHNWWIWFEWMQTRYCFPPKRLTQKKHICAFHLLFNWFQSRSSSNLIRVYVRLLIFNRRLIEFTGNTKRKCNFSLGKINPAERFSKHDPSDKQYTLY